MKRQRRKTVPDWEITLMQRGVSTEEVVSGIDEYRKEGFLYSI
jgi:hypothetical protein